MSDFSISFGAPRPALARARASAAGLAVCASFVCLAPSPARAEAAAGTRTLPETVTTATRSAQPLSDLVADVSVIDRAEIERSGAQAVADVLARLPGVQMARNGGPGGVSSVYLRGAEARFTAVYLDGVRIDSQSVGGANWEALPLSQIDRIEVLRGPAAAVYGSDAVGGVVQLFTRKGEGPPAPYVGLSLGSHGTVRAEAGVSGSSGAVDYSLGAARERSSGFDARTDAGHDPDEDGYRSSSGNLRLGWQIAPGQRLEGSLLASNLDSQYDGYGYDPLHPADDRSSYRLRTAGLSWSAQWTEIWHTRLSVTDSQNQYETQPSFYATETRLRGYLVQNEWRVGPHLLSAALERREDQLDNAPGVGPYASPGLSRGRAQNGIALGYGFNQGPHSLQLNARHDDDSEFGGNDTGSIAYGFSFAEGWRATASAGSSFRAPTLYQRFSEYGVANLQPEEGRNVELGLRYAQGATSAGLVVYQNRVKNLIGFDYSSTACASYFGCYANTGRAQYEGVTLTASQRLGDVTLRGSVDWQNPRDLDTGKLLVQRARQYGTLGLDWRLAGWLLGAEVQASGLRYADAANTRVLPGYGLVNLSASRPIGRDWSFTARVDNLADKDYQIVRNYATPGRTFYLGLKWMPKL